MLTVTDVCINIAQHFVILIFVLFCSIPIQVPTACALFPNEIVLSPEFVLRQKLPNLVEISDMPRGGHFAAFEEPKILADHVYLSVKKFNEKILEDNNKNKNV